MNQPLKVTEFEPDLEVCQLHKKVTLTPRDLEFHLKMKPKTLLLDRFWSYLL